MKSKKGLIAVIASTAVAIVALFAVVTASVYAYTRQTVSTAIVVSYTASNIKGVVSASYQVKNSDTVNMTTTGTSEGATSITFTGSETSNSSASLLPLGSIALSYANNYVTFKYVFQNTDTKACNVTISTTDLVLTNTTLTISASQDDYEDLEDSDFSAIVVGTNNSGSIPAGVTGCFYLRVSITDINDDASFSGNFHVDLSPV